MEESWSVRYSKGQVLKFILPSLLGVALFLIPIQFRGERSLIAGIFVTLLQDVLGASFPALMTILLVVPTVVALIHFAHPIPYILARPRLKEMCSSTKFWLAVRVIGAVLAPMILFRVGPEWIWSANTGGNVVLDLLPTCGAWFLASGLFLPLLTDFGAMDFTGAMCKRIARPLFRLPGRSMMDCFASWIGSGVCGTMLTISQYNTGYYTAREAAIIITNFSVVGIGFCSAIAQHLEITSTFFPFYLTIIVAGLICAVVTPRIWPLSKISNEYNPEVGKQLAESSPAHVSDVRWGFHVAVSRAEKGPSFKKFISDGLFVTFNIIANTCPILVAFGTVALIVAEYTPFFTVISYPLSMLLQVLEVPYAAEAAPAMIIGFADQFIPVLMGSRIPSLYTRFLIGSLTVLQIVYMTEIGALVLTSKVPLKFGKLVVIFLERTVICLPVVMLMARIFAIS